MLPVQLEKNAKTYCDAAFGYVLCAPRFLGMVRESLVMLGMVRVFV